MDSSQMYQVVLECIQEEVYVRDLDGRLLYINPAVERLTGWALNEARGKKCYHVFGNGHQKCIDRCTMKNDS